VQNDIEGGTLPSGRLVFGTSTYNGPSGAVERMRIDSAGNVGIGTTAPTKKLTVKVGSANDDGIFIQDENGNTRTDLGLAGTAGAREGRIKLIDDSGNTNVQIHSDTTSYFNGGNVGIGTTDPSAKLELVQAAGSIPQNINYEGEYPLGFLHYKKHNCLYSSI
jgi:hypothetical protein